MALMLLLVLSGEAVPNEPGAEAPRSDEPCPRVTVSESAVALRTAADTALGFIAARRERWATDCPEMVPALRALVVRLVETGEFERARRACAALAGGGLEREDLLLCARAAMRRGRVDEGRHLLTEFVATTGPDHDARVAAALRAAEVLEEAARYREAAEFLGGVLGDGAPRDLVLRRIHDLLRAGERMAAREAMDRAIRNRATDKAFLREACLLFVRFGDTTTAVRIAEYLMSLAPPAFGEAEADAVLLVAEATGSTGLVDRVIQRWLGDLETTDAASATWRAAALSLERHGFPRAAYRVVERGLDRGVLSEAEDWLRLARLAIRESRIEEGHRALDRLLEQPGGRIAWDHLADVWLHAGLAEEAVSFLRRHEDLSDLEWVLTLGRALHQARRPEEEEALYEQAAARIEKGPGAKGPHKWWTTVGERYRERPDLRRALDAFRKALRAARTDAERAQSHLDIAEVLLARKEDAQAEVLSAMEAGAGDPAVEFRIERLLDRLEEASNLSLALLEAAAQRDFVRPEVFQRLALARLKAHKHREAVEAFRRYVESASDDLTRRTEALEEALKTLLDADRPGEAVYLLRWFEGRFGVAGMGERREASRAADGPVVTLHPRMLFRIGMACATLGDRLCASRYFQRFLDGPIDPEADYSECAKTLASLGLWGLAERAVETMRRALGDDATSEVALVAGEVALARGRLDAAEAEFLKVAAREMESVAITDEVVFVNLKVHKRKLRIVTMPERVARIFEEAGRLRLAASWWTRAAEEYSDASRLVALERLLAVQARLGDLDAARQTLRKILAESPSEPPTRDLLETIAEVGLMREAAEAGRRILSDPAWRDREEGVSWLAGLFAMAGQWDDLLALARRMCLEAPSGTGNRLAPNEEHACIETVRALARFGRSVGGSGISDFGPGIAGFDGDGLREALAILEARCEKRGCDPPTLIEIARMRLRKGDLRAAGAAAREVALRCESPDVILSELGPEFRELRAWEEYLDVLEILRKDRGFERDRRLTFETARVLFATGDRDAGMLLLSAYLATGRGREGEVHRLLVSEGLWEEAARLVAEAPDAVLEGMGIADLHEVAEHLTRMGHDVGKVLNALAGLPRSEESIGRLLFDLGRHREAAEHFARVGTDRISPEGAFAWVRALWVTGERETAFRVAREVWGERPHEEGRTGTRQFKEDGAQDCSDLVDFFLEEEAIGLAWSMYQVCGRGKGSAQDLGARLALAVVRSGDERFLTQARDIFLDALRASSSVSGVLADFIRVEAARGRAGDLIREVRKWGDSRILLEAQVLAACLSGRDADMEDAVAALSGPKDEQDPRGLLAAARALLTCGRFADAYRLAIAGLERSGPDGPLGALSRVAVRSGPRAGHKDAPRKVEGLIRSRVEDRARRERLVARVRGDSGDWVGRARALLDVASMDHSNLTNRIEALRAALMADEPGLASHAANLILESAENPVEGGKIVADLVKTYLRGDLLGVVLIGKETEGWPKDPGLMRTLLEARLRDGPDHGLWEAAERYVRSLADARSAWADVVTLASENLRLALAKEGLHRLEAMGGVPDAQALMAAGLALLRAGDQAQGRDLVIRAVTVARSKAEFLSRLAEVAVSDPEVPEDLVEEALRAVEGLGVQRRAGEDGGWGLGDLPLVRAARCLARDAAPAETMACLRTLPPKVARSVLDAAFRKALLVRNWPMSEALLRAIQQEDGSRASAIRLAAVVVETLWPAGPQTRGPARDLARLVREGLARTGTRTLPAYPSLEAHLAHLAEGPRAGLSVYETRLFLAPAEAETRNNLAYFLSVGGVDVARALNEVRLALALSSRGHPFYAETEAWAEFLRGETRKAIHLQERASHLWHLDQGGGLAESFLHLGRMYEALGYLDKAEAAFRRAAVLEPLEIAGIEALHAWRALVRQGRRAID